MADLPSGSIFVLRKLQINPNRGDQLFLLAAGDFKFGAAAAAPAIPALESALGSHSCGALSSAQVPLL
jgi:hypothetical protein